MYKFENPWGICCLRVPGKVDIQLLLGKAQSIRFKILVVSVAYSARLRLVCCAAKFVYSAAQENWIFQDVEGTSEIVIF